tara:strand:+ start:784 stop:1089 length:306 start_codon:yes stop_codon:yes gene_type:complete
MTGRIWIVFIAAVIVAAFCVRSPVAKAQEQYCFPSLKAAAKEISKHGETLRYTVVMKIGALAHIYMGADSMTILVENPSGVVCTGPALLGDIINTVKETCA